MQSLQATEFNWHSQQPDVPAMDAAEMKAFMDAPIHILLEKVNEIIRHDNGEELRVNNLFALQTALQEALELVNATLQEKAEKSELTSVEEQLRTEIDAKMDKSEAEGGFAEVRAQQQADMSNISASLESAQAQLREEFGEQFFSQSGQIADLESGLEDQAIAMQNKQDILAFGKGLIKEGNLLYAEISGDNLSDCVKNGDTVTYSKPGLVSMSSRYGLIIHDQTRGEIGLAHATEDTINNRATETRPMAVTTRILDYAVKKALTESLTTWSEEEKAAARALLGIE